MRRWGGQSRRPRTANIGIIAEDPSDVQVLNELIKKVAKSPYRIRSFAAGGCGKIIGKANAWAQNLHDQGCKYLLLVHDLDRKQLPALRTALVSALGKSAIQSQLIVIPVREIEAWLLADHEAIINSMSLDAAMKKIPNPEGLQNPKEYLGRLIWVRSGHTKRYINAIHNVKIAAACKPVHLQRCASYEPFHKFIQTCVK